MSLLIISVPEGIKYATKQIVIGGVTKYVVTISSDSTVTLSEGAIKIGYFGFVKDSLVMTHMPEISNCDLPFAFPAFCAKVNAGGVYFVVDYYKTSVELRKVIASQGENAWVSLTNACATLGKNKKLSAVLYLGETQSDSLSDLIGNCAQTLLETESYLKREYAVVGGQTVDSYKQACVGLVSNLMDKRAVVNDGIGTFNPYGYHEIGAYSESFACMDVAKGMYRFALSNDLYGPLEYIKKEVYKLCDASLKHPWIADCHNTHGFFHFAWGSIPQDSGVAADIPRDDLFSDYCGHEEGENLLSTFKYFDRVNILGEIALLQNDSVIKDGFLRTLPFVETLRNEDFSQPVSYDLDTHVPVTGNYDGGSAGGAALYALINFNAYRLTNDERYLDFALRSVKAANKLDYDHMFSMRCAPKPIAVAAVVRANVYAYQFTGESEYLYNAERVAQGIFASYYLSPHPYCYFSTVGFGYACAKERWEAFREMEETLWLLSPFMKYTDNEALFTLYLLNKQSALRALPINGNPYGNLEREYESFGGEYIPFEFSTGHVGDNPPQEGGSQSDKRQIKEIYGSGELFLAELMYENYARTNQPHILILCVDCDITLPKNQFVFKVFNPRKQTYALATFNVPKGNYELMYGNQKLTFSDKTLAIGVKLSVQRGVTQLTLKRTSKPKHELVEKKEEDTVAATQIGNEVCLKWRKQIGAQFYKVICCTEIGKKTHLTTNQEISIVIDSELTTEIEVLAITKCSIVTVGKKTLRGYKKLYESSLVDLLNDSTKVITSNFDVVSDGHTLMFYRKELCKNKGRILFDLGNIRGNYYFEIQIGSVNNGVHYTITVSDGKDRFVTQNINDARYFCSEMTFDGHVTVCLDVRSDAGLGLSVTKLSLYKTVCCGNPVLPLRMIKNGVRAEIKENFYYAVVVITKIDKAFEILLDGEPTYGLTELRFFDKVNRQNRGIYKIPLKNGAKTIEIKGIGGGVEVKCVRLTQFYDYPLLTDYLDLSDERKFNND